MGCCGQNKITCPRCKSGELVADHCTKCLYSSPPPVNSCPLCHKNLKPSPTKLDKVRELGCAWSCWGSDCENF